MPFSTVFSNLRNHRKSLIVDSREAIVGGMNIAKEYMGPVADPKRWIDLCVSIEGSSVQDVVDIFKSDWKFTTGQVIEPRTLESTKTSEKSAQVVGSGPDVIGDPLYDSLLTLIYGATNRIWIGTPYFVPDESLAKALELAAKRGVNVQILLPKKSNHILADMARGTYLRQLSDAGCNVTYSKKMLHAKAVIVDNECGLLGSANFDMRSLLLNFELGVFVWSKDEIQSLDSWFKNMFLNSEKASFKTNLWINLTEGVGRVLGPLI